MGIINYDNTMERIKQVLLGRERLLLHCCCAPCASGVLPRLVGFDVSLFFYNPNIDSYEEYALRAGELDKLKTGVGGETDCALKAEVGGETDCTLKTGAGGDTDCTLKAEVGGDTDCTLKTGAGGETDSTLKTGADGETDCALKAGAYGEADCKTQYFSEIIVCDYNNFQFYDKVKGLEEEREGGGRCRECIRLRLFNTAEYAANNGYEWFCSTLSVSPHKNAQLINELGQEAAEVFGVKYLPNDFKKRGGFLESTKASIERGIYRQKYCGCVFSKHDKE